MRTLTAITALATLVACGGGGGGNTTTPPIVTPPPGSDTQVWAIQGSGDTSPLVGQTVTVTAVVTGDFQENDADTRRNLRGFYIQDSPDGDLATSDAIFVFDGTNPALDVAVGDLVEVGGTVQEYFGETQIDADTVRVVGVGSLIPFPLNLPAAATATNSDGQLIADLEYLEGTLVEFTDELTVTDVYNLGRYGDVVLSEGGRIFRFTNDNAPDDAGFEAHAEESALRSIVLDDGLSDQNPDSIHYLDAGSVPGYSIRLGDTVAGLTGVLRYSRGSGSDGAETWRLEPTIDPVFVSANPRPGRPGVGGSLVVGGFNVLNFFTTIDTGANICGPGGDEGCRGADTAAEYDRQLDKTVTQFIESGADILGLTELENNSSASLSALVDELNVRTGAGAWAYIDTGTIHDDVIKAGLIYRTASVTPVGAYALLDRTVDSRFNDERNRPSLAQAFDVVATGARFSVVVNHLKSKGSSCDADGDPDTGDGQGNCNLTRVNAAAALADWVATDPTGSGDSDYLVIGDMNAYFMEDPIEVFRSGGLVDLLAGESNPYSYVFAGQSGALDHAFATSSLAPQVTGALEWHINADEPPVLDYNLEFGRDAGLFDATSPYRASDHDPTIVGLELTP
jgi:predicted extracellular nuclease